MPDKSEWVEPRSRQFSVLNPWLVLFLLLLGFLCRTIQLTRPLSHALVAVLVTLCFAIAARLLQAVTMTAAIAGFVATAVLFVSEGLAMFGAVVLVFVLTHVATKFQRQRKADAAIAERSGGRSGRQVLANIGGAALSAALAQLTPWHTAFILGSIASLAEAASDTCASEIGKALAREPVMITSGKVVPAGTNGAISLPGTFAGITASCLLAFEARLTGMLTWSEAAAVVAIAIAGMFLDSFLGATLERQGKISNNGVNLLSSGFAVLAGVLLGKIRSGTLIPAVVR